MAKNGFEMYTAVLVASDVNNDPVMFTETVDSDVTKEMTTTVGRPDELLVSKTGPNELLNQTGVGHPTAVFVHAGDLARLTGCALETGRNWLDRFEQQNLVERVADGSANVGDETRDVYFYRPLVTDAEEVMARLYEMAGRQPPEFVAATEAVTPGQFEHIGGSEFRFTGDKDIIVDVAKPADSTSLQDHVAGQLQPYGMVPSSPKNFVHDLRKKADLI